MAKGNVPISGSTRPSCSDVHFEDDVTSPLTILLPVLTGFRSNEPYWQLSTFQSRLSIKKETFFYKYSFQKPSALRIETLCNEAIEQKSPNILHMSQKDPFYLVFDA